MIFATGKEKGVPLLSLAGRSKGLRYHQARGGYDAS
jgi:hypothetical protein